MTSARMSRQRTRDTDAELGLRKLLHAKGYRYRVNRPLPGLSRRRADLTFSKQRTIVFVDGCFWHVCPHHGTRPKRNSEWWARKLARNVARDRETDEHLALMGWKVVRVWEHETAAAAAEKVEAALWAAARC
ncbi:very short patch repair endonuclease [Mycolicibacterium sp. XJ2546]